MPGSAKCRSCGEEIEWQKNEETGKNVPMCVAHNQSHFKCCPQAKEWSGKGSGDRSGAKPAAQEEFPRDADGHVIEFGMTVEVVKSNTPAGIGTRGKVYFAGRTRQGQGPTMVAFNPLDAPAIKVLEPPHHVRIVPAGAKPASQSAGGSATAPPAQTSPRAAPASQAPAAPAGSGGATTGAVPPVTGSGLSAPAKTPGKGGYGPPT